jgi:hypothetical protein
MLWKKYNLLPSTIYFVHLPPKKNLSSLYSGELFYLVQSTLYLDFCFLFLQVQVEYQF